jgi:two-component system, cell cycle response regulator DivK
MLTIMLVEDNSNNAAMIEDIFTFDRIPAKLVLVTDGEEALQSAVASAPALILMDLRLPGIDGLETTQILKGCPLTKDIPVWAITAYAMPGDEEKARAAGCCRYFTKPLSVRGFGDCLREFLRDATHTEEGDNAAVKSTDR